MDQVQGHCDVKFKELRGLFQQYLESGEELGASIVVNIDGQNVVDIWGGYADPDRTRPWKEDTIVNVFSTTKTITAIAVLMLIDRGLLDANAKVAEYWPEFAQNGKQDVEAPWWPPGTASGYHSLTYGHLAGELVRRMAGKSLKQFVAEEIAGPLHADFQIGALERDWPRVATLVPPPQSPDMGVPDQGSVAGKTMEGPSITAGVANTEGWRRADIGAANGHGNARSVARILSAVTLGGRVDGKYVLSPETIDTIFQEQTSGVELVTMVPTRFGMGFGLPGKNTYLDWVPSGRICLWGGWGGSTIIMDLDRRLTISYAMNKMANVGMGSDTAKAYVKAIYTALGVSWE